MLLRSGRSPRVLVVCGAALGWAAGVALLLSADGEVGRTVLGKAGGGAGGVPIGFWKRSVEGADPSLDAGMYGGEDPWAKADGGSYALWAEDAKKTLGWPRLRGRGSVPASGSDGEEPDEHNQKNGWEEYQFDKWVRKQGGEPNDFWKDQGFKKVGEEYPLALRRLGIKSFGDLLAFDERDDDEGGDLPAFDCKEGMEPEGERSGHHMCGQLKKVVEEGEKEKGDLWGTDSDITKGGGGGNELTTAGIRTHVARARAEGDKWKRVLTGKRPWDDGKMLCYSKFQDDIGFRECMRALEANVDPKTGRRKSRGRSWESLTKGLWGDRGGLGSVDDNRGFMGQSWAQMTRDLWDKQPYKERNGLQY